MSTNGHLHTALSRLARWGLVIACIGGLSVLGRHLYQHHVEASHAGHGDLHDGHNDGPMDASTDSEHAGHGGHDADLAHRATHDDAHVDSHDADHPAVDADHPTPGTDHADHGHDHLDHTLSHETSPAHDAHTEHPADAVHPDHLPAKDEEKTHPVPADEPKHKDSSHDHGHGATIGMSAAGEGPDDSDRLTGATSGRGWAVIGLCGAGAWTLWVVNPALCGRIKQRRIREDAIRSAVANVMDRTSIERLAQSVAVKVQFFARINRATWNGVL